MAWTGPLVTVVGFHHSRGPEVEFWLGVEDGVDPAADNDWPLLPFMALSDGAHASEQEFSFFTLRQAAQGQQPATSLFGIACTRQINARKLKNRPPDVTRSTVQKAVVVVTPEPQHFGQLREKLSVVTNAWFDQGDFSDVEILKTFQESLSSTLKAEGQQDQYLGLSLREMIHEFKYQTLVLFKCCLLQPKTRSLIPGLLRALEDCADPTLDNYASHLKKPTSLRTSERSSLLAYMGLPLQIFGKGGFFGPYTPLQQLDLLANYGTKSYIVGSTNSLLLQQKDRYSDILINLDETTINITSPSLRSALSLSAADRRWIDFLTQTVNDTWDPENPSRPNTHGYVGSEEFIRLQFEEYILALLSCVKHHLHLESHLQHQRPIHQPHEPSSGTSTPITSDPVLDFGGEFLSFWRTTSNFAVFSRITADAPLFDIVEPRHPCAGGLTIEDVQRRLAQQVAELHLDERVRDGREVLNKHLATGQKKVSTAFNNLWADIEAMREAQRKRQTQNQNKSSFDENSPAPPLRPNKGSLDASTASGATNTSQSSYAAAWANRKAPDLSAVQAQASAAGQKAGAYLSSWGAWASDKKKAWEERRAANAAAAATTDSAVLTPGKTASSPSDPRPGITRSPTSPSRLSGAGGGRREVGGDEDLSARTKRWSSNMLKRPILTSAPPASMAPAAATEKEKETHQGSPT